MLLHRLSDRGRGQMPPLVSNHVDDAAVKLFRDWIAGLKSDQVFVREWKMEDLVPSLDGLGSGARSNRAARRFVIRAASNATAPRGRGEVSAPI